MKEIIFNTKDWYEMKQ